MPQAAHRFYTGGPISIGGMTVEEFIAKLSELMTPNPGRLARELAEDAEVRIGMLAPDGLSAINVSNVDDVRVTDDGRFGVLMVDAGAIRRALDYRDDVAEQGTNW